MSKLRAVVIGVCVTGLCWALVSAMIAQAQHGRSIVLLLLVVVAGAWLAKHMD